MAYSWQAGPSSGGKLKNILKTGALIGALVYGPGLVSQAAHTYVPEKTQNAIEFVQEANQRSYDFWFADKEKTIEAPAGKGKELLVNELERIATSEQSGRIANTDQTYLSGLVQQALIEEKLSPQIQGSAQVYEIIRKGDPDSFLEQLAQKAVKKFPKENFIKQYVEAHNDPVSNIGISIYNDKETNGSWGAPERVGYKLDNNSTRIIDLDESIKLPNGRAQQQVQDRGLITITRDTIKDYLASPAWEKTKNLTGYALGKVGDGLGWTWEQIKDGASYVKESISPGSDTYNWVGKRLWGPTRNTQIVPTNYQLVSGQTTMEAPEGALWIQVNQPVRQTYHTTPRVIAKPTVVIPTKATITQTSEQNNLTVKPSTYDEQTEASIQSVRESPRVYMTTRDENAFRFLRKLDKEDSYSKWR